MWVTHESINYIETGIKKYYLEQKFFNLSGITVILCVYIYI